MHTNHVPPKKENNIHISDANDAEFGERACLRAPALVCVCAYHNDTLQIVVLNKATTHSFFDLHFIVFLLFCCKRRSHVATKCLFC